MVKPASRIEQIPPYLFARIDKKKEEVRKKGVDLVDFGIGDPDIPTPANIIEKMKGPWTTRKITGIPAMKECRNSERPWRPGIKDVLGSDLNPATEVVTLIGSKEGIAHIPWAYVEEGDVVLVPSPGYPVYKIATVCAGDTLISCPLRKKMGFCPGMRISPKIS